MADAKLKIFYTGNEGYKTRIVYAINTCNKKALAVFNRESKTYSIPLFTFGYVQISSFKDFKKTIRYFVAKKVKVIISEEQALTVVKKLRYRKLMNVINRNVLTQA